MNICVITQDKAVLDLFKKDGKELDMQPYFASSLEEAKEKNKTLSFIGCLVDPDLVAKDLNLSKWQEENIGNQRPIALIKKPLTAEGASNLLKRLQEFWNLFQTGFKQLQEEYRTTFPEKEERLTRLVNQLSQKIDEETLNALKYELHKIAGSAGLYGYGEVGNLCKQFNELLRQKIIDLNYSKPSSSWNQEFQEYLEKIKNGFSVK